MTTTLGYGLTAGGVFKTLFVSTALHVSFVAQNSLGWTGGILVAHCDWGIAAVESAQLQ